MKASELIAALQNVINLHGDLPIVGGYLSDDQTVDKVITTDEYGCDTEDGNTQPVGIFLTQ